MSGADHPKKIAVVVNPASQNGRTAKQWPHIERSFREVLDDFTLLTTQRPGHASELTRRALQDGHDRIVSVGGDGTHHEVLNGFFDGYLPVNPSAAMAIYPHGTGSDLARTLGVLNHRDALPLLNGGHRMLVDVGRVTFTSPDGGTDVRYFINIADFGIGGAVTARVNKGSKRFGPFLTFLGALVRTLMTFKSRHVTLQIDGTVQELDILNVVVAKGRYYGGGIHIAPDSKMDGGHFRVVLIHPVKFLRALRCLPRLYNGTYLELHDIVSTYTASRVVAQSDEEVLLNLDGEQPGKLPAAIEILPAALSLVVSPPTAQE